MKILSDNNTILGIRLDPRVPAVNATIATPAPLPDFGTEADLIVERQVHAVTRQERDAALVEVARLKQLLAQQSTDSAKTATLWLRFERVTLALTGETCADVLARMEYDAREERELLAATADRAKTIRIERASAVARAYYVDEPVAKVVAP